MLEFSLTPPLQEDLVTPFCTEVTNALQPF